MGNFHISFNKPTTIYSDHYAIIMVTTQTLVGTINKQYYVNQDGVIYPIEKYDPIERFADLIVDGNPFYIRIGNKIPPSFELFTEHFAKISKKLNVNRIGFYDSLESFSNGSFDYYVIDKRRYGALIKQKNT